MTEKTIAFTPKAQLRKRGMTTGKGRMLAAICVSPYSRKGTTPHRLLPLPWDRAKPKKAAPTVSKEDALRRFEEVLGKMGGG